MYDERRKVRSIKLIAGAMKLKERYAAILDDTQKKLDEMRIVCLSAEAGNRALWLCLLAKGLVTEAERQDWLDRGVMDLLDQIDGKAAEVMTVDGKPN